MDKKDRNNYDRLFNLLSLINYLSQSRTGLTYDEITERFEWKRRTLERMIKEISNHYEVSKKRGYDNKVRFRITEQNPIPLRHINKSEITALNAVINSVQNNDELKKPLKDLSEKLQSFFQKKDLLDIEQLSSISATISAPRRKIKLNRQVSDKLQEAILSYHMIKIKFQYNGIKYYDICPLGILYGTHNNYLLAFPYKDAERPFHYTLDLILDMEVLPSTFDAKDFDIHEYAKKSFGVWISEQGGYDVKWLASPSVAKDVVNFTFHPTQKLTKNSDGSVLIEFHADGLMEMAWHLFTWGGKIKPLEPPELVNEYKKQLSILQKSIE